MKAVVNSSNVPISHGEFSFMGSAYCCTASLTVTIAIAEAVESLTMLCELCPFFLRSRALDGEDWLEMPASTGAVAPASPGSGSGSSPGGAKSKIPRFMDGLATSASPGRVKSEEELMGRSPRRVKREDGGLRQVRQIIRRELEVDEDDF